MAVHEFYTTIEKNDVVGLVDDLASKTGVPYYGPVPTGSATPTIVHNLGTTDVDVTVIRQSDKLQVGLPVERIDQNSVKLTFSVAPLGGEYRVIVSAGTGQAGFGGGTPGQEGGPPSLHAATHAANGTDPLTPTAIGAAIVGHTHGSNYAPFTHANRHAVGGGDTITPSSIGAANLVHGHSGTDISSGTIDILRLPTGTTGTKVATGNHVHGPHATTHTSEGSDPLSPADIGAADVNHNHQNRIIPAGGSQGQVLTKLSANNFDVGWTTPAGAGGPTNGPFPVVVLPTGPTVDLDASQGNWFRIVMTQNTLLNVPTNPVDGKIILIEINAVGVEADWLLDLTINTPGGFATGRDFYYTSKTIRMTCDYLQAIFVAAAGGTEQGGPGGRWRVLSYIKGYAI